MTYIVRPNLCVLPPLMLAFLPYKFDIKISPFVYYWLLSFASATFTTLMITHLSTAYTQRVAQFLIVTAHKNYFYGDHFYDL